MDGTQDMSGNHIQLAIDVIGVPSGAIFAKLAMINVGTLTGDFFAVFSFIATGMVIIVNADKFVEKVKKYWNNLKQFFKRK